jgi:hypothetical protein
MDEALDDFEFHHTRITHVVRDQAVAFVDRAQAMGIEDANVNFRQVVAVGQAGAASNGAIVIAGGQKQEATGSKQARREGDDGIGIFDVFDDLDDTDDIELRVRMTLLFIEIENAETVVGAQKIGVGPNIMSRDLDGSGAAGHGKSFAGGEKLEQAAGPATEVEPPER